MKTILFLLSFIFILTPALKSEEVFAASAASENQKTYYAKVLDGNSYFYEKASNEQFEKLFILPSTYFVLLVGEEGEYYSAKYMDLFGYVKKTEVTPMEGTPVTPYATSTFRAYDRSGLEVYSKPQENAEVVGKLGFLQENIKMYGFTYGDELFPSSTNQWIYCFYESGGQTIRGYAFKYYCDEIKLAGENPEYFPEITGTLDFGSDLPNGGGLSDTVKAIIILAVSMPCLIVLYLLLSPSKRRHKNKGEKVKSPARIKRGKDYYEFNEDDL